MAIKFKGSETSGSIPSLGERELAWNIADRIIFTADSSSNIIPFLGTDENASWGNITGNITDQVDLQNALDSKQSDLGLGIAGQILATNSSATDTEWITSDYISKSPLGLFSGTFSEPPTAVELQELADKVNEIVHILTSYITPSYINDFSASDDIIGSVVVTWTNAIGTPTPTYDLYKDNVLVSSDISSGYAYPLTDDTSTYNVRATNAIGYTDSNTDSGTSIAEGTLINPDGDFILDANGDYITTTEI